MYRNLMMSVVCLFNLGLALCAEEIATELSQNKVAMNDSFSIVFTSEKPIKINPDFSPLSHDFTILSSSQEQSVSMNNSEVHQEIRWNLVLMPKREGNLTIPSINFGSLSSLPQSIEVTNAIISKQDDAVFLETELSPDKKAYEKALLTYTIRLYCSKKMAQASLSEVKVNDPDAIIQRMGNDIEYDHINQNGVRYRVYERKYAVIPQHTGELVFSPIVFEGAVISGGSSIFGLQTSFKRLNSDEKKIEVQPIPPPFKATDWLAVNDVKISEEWSSIAEKMSIGEPVTRTISLSAEGCLGDQIPTISLDFPKGVKHYLDKPETSNQIGPNGLIGKKHLKVALVPTTAGEFIIPKIKVAWWDLKTDQVRYAELPSRVMNVLATDIAMNDKDHGVDLVQATPQVLNKPLLLSEDSSKMERSRQLFIIVAVAAILFPLLISVFVIVYKKRRIGKKHDSLRQAKQALKAACMQDDPKKIEGCLLAWSAIAFPDQKIHNLIRLKHLVPNKMQDLIDELNHALYGKKSDFCGKSLWIAVKQFKHVKSKELKSAKRFKLLTSLYPTRD